MDYLENIIHRIEIGERKRGNGQELFSLPSSFVVAAKKYARARIRSENYGLKGAD